MSAENKIVRGGLALAILVTAAGCRGIEKKINSAVDPNRDAKSTEVFNSVSTLNANVGALGTEMSTGYQQINSNLNGISDKLDNVGTQLGRIETLLPTPNETPTPTPKSH